MVRIDSNKVKIPFEAFDFIDVSSQDYKHQYTKKRGEIISDKYILENLGHGYNRTEIDNLNQVVILSTSAKILGDNYDQGICTNTVEQFCDSINRDYLHITTDNFIKNGQLLSFDVTDNLHLNCIKDAVDSVIQLGGINRNYLIDHYRKNGQKGYVAKRNVSSYKERQIGYNKLNELATARNRKFVQDTPNVWKSFNSNTLRVECNFTSFAHIRKVLNVQDNNFLSVLSSDAKVNYSIFERIIETGKQLDVFSEYYKGMSWNKIIQDYGYKAILAECDNNPEKVKLLIRLKMPRTETSDPATYQIKKFTKWYATQNDDKRKQINRHIEQIRQLLKAS